MNYNLFVFNPVSFTFTYKGRFCECFPCELLSSYAIEFLFDRTIHEEKLKK